MDGEKIFVLAFPITISKAPSTIYEYLVPEEYIGFARSLLYQENIPHAVERRDGVTGLIVYAADESDKLENRVGGAKKKQVKQAKLSPDIINRLISSAIRIAFINNGWVSSSSKLYNPDKSEAQQLAKELALRYTAVRIAVDDLGNETKALFIDPTSKIEFIYSLRYIHEKYPQQAEKIDFVKIMGTTVSFYTVKSEVPETNIEYGDVIEKAIETINMFRGTEIDTSLSRKTDNIVYVTPKSVKLSTTLQNRIPGLPTIGKNRVAIPLPMEILTPVGSLDNIALFEKVPILTKPPHERFKQALEILTNTILESVNNVKGMQVSINTQNIIEVPPSSVHLTQIKSKYWKWYPKFEGNSKRVLLVVTSPGNSKRYDRRCSIATDIIKSLAVSCRLLSSPRLVQEIMFLDNLEDILKAYKDYDEKFAILLYDKSLDKEEIDDIIGRFEYKAASQGFYPHELGIETDIDEDDFKRRIPFKIQSIIKDFATRIGAIPNDLNPPSGLEDAYVVGIDATTVSVGRNQIYLGVVVVTVKADNIKDYSVEFKYIDESDIEVLTTIVEDIASRYKKALIMVNKSSIERFLEELEKEKLQNHVIVGISKTHSYSRILASASIKGGAEIRYVNPPRSGVFVELSPTWLKDIRISRYLGVTTNSIKGEYEKGTIRPVIVNIAGNADHKRVLDYIQDLTHYASISTVWLPSIPWPLHKADKLCKKLNRIIKVSNKIPDSSILRRL
ncbi:MAG: hypothetical protein QW464_03735 [Ignisphaera sp.]